jgi:hypothetical protein
MIYQPTIGVTSVVIHYSLSVDKIAPIRGSIGGGQLITLIGNGMNNQTVVTICEKVCKNDFSETIEGRIFCHTPSIDTTQSITKCPIGIRLHTEVTSPSIEYTYDLSMTPMVFDITPNSGQIVGGTILTITGMGFKHGTNVKIGDYPCQVTSRDEERVECRTSEVDHSQVLPIMLNVPSMGSQQKWFSYWYVNRWSSVRSWGCDEDVDFDSCVGAPKDGDIVEIPAGIEILLDARLDSLIYLEVLYYICNVT